MQRYFSSIIPLVLLPSKALSWNTNSYCGLSHLPLQTQLWGLLGQWDMCITTSSQVWNTVADQSHQPRVKIYLFIY